MEYLLKASGIVIILLLFYLLFLKDETFFKSIRTYFIFGLASTLLIPLIEIPIFIETAISTINYSNFEIVNNETLSKETINWTTIFITIYLFGVAFYSLKFLGQLASLAILIIKHPINKRDGYLFIETSKNVSPFSFFKIIVYNKSQFSIDELRQIINHEKAHANQWHSIDTLLAHLLVILLWFNPFVWLFKKVVQQNLEFLADASAIEKSECEKQYQLTLIKTYSAVYCTETTNNFYNSLIKKRIVMLHKNRSKNKRQWKYALILPLLTAFVFTFNTKTIAQEKHTSKKNHMKLEIVLDKNSTNDDLANLKEPFSKEFDIKLNFKGIKRNSDNEITAIKINAKGENTSASFENSGTEPISPIRIAFDSDSNSISIGNLTSKYNKYIYKIDGDKKGHKNVWIHKDEDGKHKTKVISEEHTIHFNSDDDEEHEIEITTDSEDGDKTKNVFIIKTDGNKIKKHKITKKGNLVFLSEDDGEPLYILDGKEIDKNEMEKIDSETIERMEVLKGSKATEKYGKKAKGGVILITTKKE